MLKKPVHLFFYLEIKLFNPRKNTGQIVCVYIYIYIVYFIILVFSATCIIKILFNIFLWIASIINNLKIRNYVCRTCAASWRKHPPLKSYLMWQYVGEDKEFLSFISEKIEWESTPSILVTRNPNWSQRSGTGTGCVKGRY
jgi:hypothetical protein